VCPLRKRENRPKRLADFRLRGEREEAKDFDLIWAKIILKKQHFLKKVLDF
jgi:hypothetical protein